MLVKKMLQFPTLKVTLLWMKRGTLKPTLWDRDTLCESVIWKVCFKKSSQGFTILLKGFVRCARAVPALVNVGVGVITPTRAQRKLPENAFKLKNKKK
uniref:Ribosomal protein S11 n=1 Tax=Romanomermis culicivorax TaxID=13658 RepID=A0A915I434_ROMCU